MPKLTLRWVGFGVLVLNTLLASWTAWTRYSRSSQLDMTATGVVVSVERTSGRSARDRIVASYTIGGAFYTVQGSSDDDASLTADNHAVDSKIVVHVSSRDPAVSSLSERGEGLGAVTGLAALLLLVTLVVAYLMFKRP